MKLLLIPVLFAGCLLFVNCSKDTVADEKSVKEDPSEIENEIPEDVAEPGDVTDEETIVYFTYSGRLSSTGEEWIILHDENGSLLDYRLVENGETIYFETAADQKPNEVTATRIFRYMINEKAQYQLYTYTGLNPGSIWGGGQVSGQEFVENGTFNLSVENIFGSVRHYTRSTSYGSFNPGSTSFPGGTGDLTFRMSEIPLIEDEDYIFSIYDGLGNNKYVILENPQDSGQYVYDFSDFLEYDSYLEVNLPENKLVYAAIYAFEEEEPDYSVLGYQISGDSSISPTSTKLGYLDKFPKYATLFVLNMDDYFYTLYKTGEKVENLTVLPKPSLSIDNSSPYEFQFSSDASFVRKVGTWSYQSEGSDPSETKWAVASPGDDRHSVGMFPEEILNHYPNLNLDKITLESLELFIQSASHQDYFSSNSTGVYHSEERITESIRFPSL